MFKLVNQCNKPLNRDLFITVAGNVGAGKSTLTKLVAGLRHIMKKLMVTHI